MIMYDEINLNDLGQLGQGDVPVPGRPARVSAIITRSGQPADGVIVELYDANREVVLGRAKTDYRGYVSFDNDTSYLPVVLKVTAPAGEVATPAYQGTITWPVPQGFWSTGLIKTWSWDRSVHFQLGMPGEKKAETKEEEPEGGELDLGKYFTLKNIAIAGGVFILATYLWNHFGGGSEE